MIVVPNMIDQWIRAIKTFTLLHDQDIYVIQGMTSLSKLLRGIDQTLHPAIIIASLPTLRLYAKGIDTYENFPSFDELHQRLNVGVRVVDEAHMNFHANVLLDLRATTKINIFLSATFDHSNTEIKKILDGHYPREARYGESYYKKYVIIHSYAYSLGLQDIPPSVYRSAKGYNHILFEKWLLQRGRSKLRRILYDVYLPILNAIYINKASPGEKCLILVSTLQMADFLKKELTQEYPDKRTGLFVGNMTEEVILDMDIILSVPKKAGTGRDIPDLVAMLTTVSERSHPRNKQFLGRLRELKNGNHPTYAYCWCKGIASHVDHSHHRTMILQPLAHEFHRIDLT
jgi:hypothetical protein